MDDVIRFLSVQKLPVSQGIGLMAHNYGMGRAFEADGSIKTCVSCFSYFGFKEVTDEDEKF